MARQAPSVSGGNAKRRSDLSRKGFAFFVVDGVLARLTKAQSADALKALKAVPKLELGVWLAREIRERVTKTGKLGDGQPSVRYGQKSRVQLSAEYMRAAGVSPRNKAMFRNEDRFHKGLRSPVGSYVITGGMWRGLEVRPMQKDVVAEFGGRSQGRGRGKVVTRRRTRGGVTTEKKTFVVYAQDVANRDKAGRIWRFHKINPLSYTQGESKRLAIIVAQDQADRVVAALTGKRYSPRMQALLGAAR